VALVHSAVDRFTESIKMGGRTEQKTGKNPSAGKRNEWTPTLPASYDEANFPSNTRGAGP
jgi:hypothetical protein